eukprot:TRINITY_DN914_c0_g1_i1.p1 TRINITY_DN914_c0_g1~~TRINITY_DN914_c0_g1_i1.p1  ORF type:complete len:625 (-),score=159.24 TRINITY_DN914_c0_g1_i1:245-2119(-)
MPDLEDLLLEAAGRTAHDANLKRSCRGRRRLSDSDSENGSASSYDDGDASEDCETSRRKHPGSKMPLKKRFESEEHDEDDDEDDDHNDGRHRQDNDSDSDFSVGSDLYKDDEDRERLAKMSELEREYILAERAEKRDSKEIRKKGIYVKDRNRFKKEDTEPPSSKLRSSVKSHSSVKEDALNEIKKRRKALDSNRREVEGIFRERESSSDLKNSHESKGEDEEDYEDSCGKSDQSGDEGNKEKVECASFEHIKAITIRRSKLEKWFMEPFFEKTIEGCFVRIGIGCSRNGRNVYRLCRVKNVDATDPNKQYKFNGKITYKFLNCFWGTESNAARWQMDRVSDSEPTLEEFKDLEDEIKKTKSPKMSKQEFDKKQAALEAINEFVYSAETVRQMLLEKKMAAQRPSNIAAEKDRLKKELELAESRYDYSEAERIRGKLKELEILSLQNKNKNEKALMLAEMNRRNRAENFRNASQTRPANTNLKAGEAGYDPFSRRWTRSQNYYSSQKSIATQENQRVLKGHKAGKIGESEFVKAMQIAQDEGKLVNRKSPLSQGVKMYALHDFDIFVSLNELQSYGGPQGVPRAYMERRQLLEATYGVQMPSNDGWRHRYTLTVNDYKRRRGLL